MLTLAQGLGYVCVANTPLAGAVGVYLDQHTTSLFRFVREPGKETAPPGIIDRLSTAAPG